MECRKRCDVVAGVGDPFILFKTHFASMRAPRAKACSKRRGANSSGIREEVVEYANHYRFSIRE
jgi:hypothetical protein